VPGVLGRIENWLQQAVEGGSRTIFRQRLQPIELAKAAARSMQRHRLVGPDGIEVPNEFRIAVHPDDFAELEPFRSSLETRIARYLAGFAEDRDLIPMGTLSASLAPDPSVRRRAVRVDARMTDGAAGGPATRPVAPLNDTELLPRIRRAPDEEAGPARAGLLVLLLEDGRQIDVPYGSVRIGRALDNEIVIADARVSRYHAQIGRDAYGPIVRDLGSTNGMSVSGRAVAEDRLDDGDVVLLGGYRIDVQLRTPADRSGRR
jgi:hypothetical protein